MKVDQRTSWLPFCLSFWESLCQARPKSWSCQSWFLSQLNFVSGRGEREETVKTLLHAIYDIGILPTLAESIPARPVLSVHKLGWARWCTTACINATVLYYCSYSNRPAWARSERCLEDAGLRGVPGLVAGRKRRLPWRRLHLATARRRRGGRGALNLAALSPGNWNGEAGNGKFCVGSGRSFTVQFMGYVKHHALKMGYV